MKFDPTKPVQTRDGRPARVLCIDAKTEVGPIVALVVQRAGSAEIVRAFGPDGRANIFADCDDDLVNLPETGERWVNVYRKGAADFVVFDGGGSREEAACLHRIHVDSAYFIGWSRDIVARVPLRFTVGEGLDPNEVGQ